MMSGNMKKKEIEYKTSFADGEILSYHKDEKGFLVIKFRLWNEKIIRISFSDTIRFCDNNMNNISEFVLLEENNFFKEALDMMYAEVPNNPAYKHYCFMNLDGNPSIHIVAADMQISE
jgi:hypothetical protein